MGRPADELVVLLVGSTPERVETLRSAVAAAGAPILVEGTIDPRTALDDPPACDCLLVELPVSGASLAELRAASWSCAEQVPVVPFTVNGEDPSTYDAASLRADALDGVIEPIERAVDATTATEPPASTGDAMVAATTDVLLAVTPDGTIQHASPAIERMTGAEASTVAGDPLLSYVHPDDHTDAVEQLQAVERPQAVEPPAAETADGATARAGEGSAGRSPVPVRFGCDDEWKLVRLERRTLLGPSPQDGAVVLARPAIPAAGRNDDGHARAHMLDAAVDPMCFMRVDGTIVAVNDPLATFLDREREDLVGTHVSSVIGDDQWRAGFDALADRLAQAAEFATDAEAAGADPDSAGAPAPSVGALAIAEDGVSYEFELDRGDETVWCEALLSMVVEDGDVVGAVGLLRDITTRKEREQQLSKYETVAEDTPIALFTFDEEATITWTNDVYPEMLGLDRDEVVGRPFPELIEAGFYDPSVVETYTDAVRTLLSSENDVEQESLELEVDLPSGKTLVNEVYISLLPLDDGEFQGTIIAFRDITEQREYERELERQNERLDAFTSVVSHDLRNPIAIADGYLEMALEDEDLDRVADARRAIDRMESLVEQLLVLSREGRAVEDPVSVELAEVARDAWATVDTGESTLEVEGSRTLLADRSRLQQALENLFRNAVEHGADGDSDRPVTVRVEVDDGSGFAVADDGVGVPTENAERVFERGFTTNPDGTGFGLDIVRTIVDAHGWSIELTESEGGGARFEIDTRH